jgi:hypothetical protein
MKAFRFRLDQALRWRATQVDLEKSRLAAAALALRQIQDSVHHISAELAAGSRQISSGEQSGEAFTHWAAYTEHSRRQLSLLETKARESEKTLATQTKALADANRRLRLLENLKLGEQSQWQAGFNLELQTFADENYLFRLQSKNGRARSSGG